MNKEEIEEGKKCLEETIQNCYAEKKAIKLNNLRKYIQKLETKVKEQEESKQAVIDYVNQFLNDEDYAKRHCKTKGKIKLIKEGLTINYKLSRVAHKILNMLEGEKK